MEKFKGTPGPWFAVEYSGYHDIQAEDIHSSPSLLNEAECRKAPHNARLTAAAPELLEALHNLVESCPSMSLVHQDARAQAVKAINKALGLPVNETDPITQAKIESEAKDV